MNTVPNVIDYSERCDNFNKDKDKCIFKVTDFLTWYHNEVRYTKSELLILLFK